MDTTNLKVRKIGAINWVGLWTLFMRETLRFLNVWSQTLLGPVVSTLLFVLIFTLALGSEGRQVMGMPYIAFLLPGLMTMVMIQNAFANTSSSIMIGKIQGNISDILLAPLNAAELTAGFVASAVMRGLACGFIVWVCSLPFTKQMPDSWTLVLLFSLNATIMLGLLGCLAGIWAQKFDQMAAVTNFVITPLSFLSGTFYPVSSLPESWIWLAMLNPFFHLINGVRTGFLGISEGPVLLGLMYVTLINFALALLVWRMFHTGYKLKS